MHLPLVVLFVDIDIAREKKGGKKAMACLSSRDQLRILNVVFRGRLLSIHEFNGARTQLGSWVSMETL